MPRFVLLLSLLGALGLAACDDDDETVTAETEVITSDFAQDPPGRVAVAGGPDACGNYHGKTPEGRPFRIDVTEGVVRCREAQHVLKTASRRLGQDVVVDVPPWSCVFAVDYLFECDQPGAAFAAHMYCRVWRKSLKADCLDRFGPP